MINDQKRGKDQGDIAEIIRKKLQQKKQQSQNKQSIQGNQYKPSQRISEVPEKVSKEASKPDKKVKNFHKPEKKIESRPVKLTVKKEPVHEVKEAPKEKKKSKKPLIILTILVLVLILAAIIVLLFIFYGDKGGGQRELNVGVANMIIYDEERAIVTLEESIDLDRLLLVEITFISSDNTEYPYNPGYIAQEYEIFASDVGLESFQDVFSLGVFFEYKQEQEQNDTPTILLTTNQTINQTNETTYTGGSGGGGGGGGGETCTHTCSSLGYECGTQSVCGVNVDCGTCESWETCQSGHCVLDCSDNGCSSVGTSCDGNMVYNCTLNSTSGCYGRTNLSLCGSREQCLNGTCHIIPDCSVDGDCNADGCYNGEFRDYYCDSSSKCNYTNLTIDERGDYCFDGLDNDCDGDVDDADAGCQDPNQYVAYWKFENNLLDEKGDHNGEPIGVVNYVEGISGSAIDVSEGSYVNVPDSDSLDIQDELTISLWVNRRSYINHGKVLIKRFDDLSSNPWEIYSIDFKGLSPGYPCFLISNASIGGQEAICDSDNLMPFNEWHHLAGVYDHREISLFVDGILSASKITQIQIGVNDMPLTIGSGNSSFYTNGNIDEVMIFNRALNDSEILEIYTQQHTALPSYSPFSRFWEWLKGFIS